MIVKPFVIAAAAVLSVVHPVRAEVLRADDTGFAIEHVRTLDATPEAAWTRLVRPAAWWHPDHTWSADAANLSLDPRAGGCFCEALPDGGSNEHLRVVHAAPGRLLRLDGRLGPLQPLPLTGVMSFELAAGESGSTTVTLRYVVAGPPGSALQNWAPPVDSVLGQQIDRFADLTIGGVGEP
ncbi:hypothetical protein HFP89_00465 [Wenzhouxiangella sp. XN79A]|uniref:hypothetical protein n=1 Tax=Wenzhouxiangella sp. XN79A TaxID=2724193 RepID=UPI00144ADB59|nr:hypothetical protein [Wenzhouxiangella sp. XN79A]NKI33636.1 hypothetical protein [Wenzhouxiangella sp. XN79A]